MTRRTQWSVITNFFFTCEKGSIQMAPCAAYNGLRGSSPLEEIYIPYEAPGQKVKQMDDDARAIRQGRPTLVPGEKGLKDIRIVEAIYKSAATGQAVKV